MGTVDQHLNLPSPSHSGLGSVLHDEKGLDDSALNAHKVEVCNFNLLSPSHSPLESTQEVLDTSASTVPNVEIRHFNRSEPSIEIENLKQNVVSHLQMLNDTLNETHESDEPLNDTTLESDDEPVKTEPSIETENLKHNVVSHMEMLHDTLNDTQSAELSSDMPPNYLSVQFSDDEKCTIADEVELQDCDNEKCTIADKVELQDRSGPAADAYFSTPMKVPPLTILHNLTMSPVSSISEDSEGDSGSEEGSEKKSAISGDEDSSSCSSTCGDSSDPEDDGTLNLTSNTCDSESCSSSDEALLKLYG
ncbi:Sodium channel protein [Frankliniella fusca]|uniref:Sodium channel protein n=1 Tax=Frankliniella fusca TaxID=407009 RepID=A0AAE1HN68_9NEOP|nr:Sodium channel protein [Frankliniella fusca]